MIRKMTYEQVWHRQMVGSLWTTRIVQVTEDPTSASLETVLMKRAQMNQKADVLGLVGQILLGLGRFQTTGLGRKEFMDIVSVRKRQATGNLLFVLEIGRRECITRLSSGVLDTEVHHL